MNNKVFIKRGSEWKVQIVSVIVPLGSEGILAQIISDNIIPKG